MAAKKVKRAAGGVRAAVMSNEPVKLTAMVNGQVVGDVVASGTIRDVAMQLARANGLKSFSVKVNGAKITGEKAGSGFPAGAKSIEVYAKDTRG